MKPCRIWALVGAPGLATLLCAVLAVFCASANAAPALELPSFQELINKPDASASVSASAPADTTAPASDADLTRSLDTVIATLDSDRQRAALVAQLKKLRDAKREADTSTSAQAG
ncbi:MAG: mechanosensitive ion channel protein MscS, partial [Caballeronia sp.]